MKIILTGAAGFIGSCFLWKLNQMGIDQVYSVDTALDIDDYPNLAGKKYLDYIPREALLKKLETNHFKDIDAIVHLGACADTTERDVDYLKRNNVLYTQELARWCFSQKKIFHYASSAAIYGDGKAGYSDRNNTITNYVPLNAYGKSKWLVDKWLIDENLTDRVVGYRYFNVFGPNEYHKGDMRSMVSKAYDQISENGQVKLFASSREGYSNGSEERDFVYVKDVCDVMAFFLEHPEKTGIFNLGTGKARTFKNLIDAVFSALKKEPAYNWIPMPERLRGQYQYFTEADMSSLQKVGYAKPFHALEDAVADYVTAHLIKKNQYL